MDCERGSLMPIRPENAKRYPVDWALRSRFVRFVRARGRCEWCGAPNNAVVVKGSNMIVAGPFVTHQLARQWLAEEYAARFGVDADDPCPWSVVVLTTAHVHDHRPEASSLLNLAALCQKCHNGHDAAARRAGARERRRAHTGDLFA